MIARMIACRDLATNEADLKKIREQVITFQTSATPTSLLLPWFPSPAMKTKTEAAALSCFPYSTPTSRPGGAQNSRVMLLMF